jgi:hypothetical protein
MTALVVLSSRLQLTIAHAPHLQHIVERQLLRDALRFDPQRPRRNELHLAPPEARRAAAIVNDHRAAVVAGHLGGAMLCPMLETGERRHIYDALAYRCLHARCAGDFPNAWRRLGKYRRRLRPDQCSRSRNAGKGKKLVPSHAA